MNRLCVRSIIVQSQRCGHWFSSPKSKGSRRRTMPTISKYLYDWEHQRWYDKISDPYPSFLNESEAFQKLDDDIKKIYSYEFMPRKQQANDELQALFNKVGIDAFEPKQRDLATHIVKLTFSIRSMKALLEKRHKDGQMRAACAAYIGRRKGLLHLLRNESAERFDKVCSVLKIKYRPQDPFDFKKSELMERKNQNRKVTYKLRREKIKNFYAQMNDEREKFYTEKEEALEELDNRLKSVNLDIRTLFQEVVDERREELLRPVHKDEERWYEREKELKEMFARLRVEKEERQMKKRRK